MRKIGLIGGMSWESSKLYYEILNREVKKRCGGLHSAEVILVSVDFAPIEACLSKRDWQGVAARLIPAAQQLEAAGAEAILLCTNTMHKLAPDIIASVSIPFFHIIDVLGEALATDGRQTSGLLGTAATIQNETYQKMLKDKYNVTTILPTAEETERMDRIIFDELCVGVISADAKRHYLDIIQNLARRGADSIIMGCTEITLLISQDDLSLPLYDTTELHAQYAATWSLSDRS